MKPLTLRLLCLSIRTPLCLALQVVDVEAAGWWRQATALPASSLQPSALITVTTTPPTAATATPFISYQHMQGTGSRVGRGGGVSGDGPALELDDCSVVASGRDRDLVRLDGSGVVMTARYSRLRGGANAAVALQQSALNLDCCELQVGCTWTVCMRCGC